VPKFCHSISPHRAVVERCRSRITVCQITIAIKSQGRRDGKQPNIPLECLRFSTFEAVQAPRISLRCDPWFLPTPPSHSSASSLMLVNSIMPNLAVAPPVFAP
jgi:hypothetical protein